MMGNRHKANVDFSNTDIVLLITNLQAPDGIVLEQFSTAEDAQGIQADGNTLRSGMILGSRILQAADFYKNGSLAMRLIELATLETLYYDEVLFPNLATVEELSTPIGMFTMMTRGLGTGTADGFFAFERWQMGWLDDAQIMCQMSGDQTTDLSAIQQAGGVKAVMVPVSPTTILVVESRRPAGFDYMEAGALVYTVDTSVGAGAGPLQVLSTDSNDDWRRGKAPLAQGESLKFCNITVTNVAAGANGDSVRVEIPGPIECQPAPTPTPAAPTGLCATVPAPQSGIMIRFINNSATDVLSVSWMDANGQLLEYFKLQPGAYMDQPASAGDRWVVKDQTGAVVLDYLASVQPTQCAPAPGTSTTPLPVITFDKNGCPVIQGAQVICYDVYGVTEAELVTSMANNSPVAPDVWATRWFISWNWPNYGKPNCTLAQATVDLKDLTVTLPRWIPPAGAPPNLIAKWADWVMNIATREQLRVNYVRDNYLITKTAIQNATCTTADAAAQKATNQLDLAANNYVNGLLKEIIFP
jgi:predicted secreted Zn-dependent protease